MENSFGLPNREKFVRSPDSGGGGPLADPDRIEGVDGERWPKWLVTEKSEVLNIQSDPLRIQIRLLARAGDSVVTPGRLFETHQRIEEMVMSGKATLEETAIWQARIEQQHKKLVEKAPPQEVVITPSTPAIIPLIPEKQSLKPPPTYFGAVAKFGSNQVYVDRPELTPTVEITDENGRDRFIFLNIHAFNYRFEGSKDAWSSIIRAWESDAKFAQEALILQGTGVNNEVFEDFLKKLEAMMSVSAAARAMEAANGSYRSYATHLLEKDERGDPIMGEVDQQDTLLLTTDPDKLILALNDPLVQRYYRRIMEDAGLVFDAAHEWHRGKPRTLEFTTDTPRVIEGRLCEYLKKGAKKGGMQKYIEEALLPKDEPFDLSTDEHNGVTKNMRMAAAKIATDAFLVDKFTEWNFILTNGGEDTELKLQPLSSWGGDPLNFSRKSRIQAPSLLKIPSPPRL